MLLDSLGRLEKDRNCGSRTRRSTFGIVYSTIDSLSGNYVTIKGTKVYVNHRDLHNGGSILKQCDSSFIVKYDYMSRDQNAC